MRPVAWAVALLAIAGSGACAAELDIPPRLPAENISIHKGPPNCSRWTDECVTCMRGTDGEAPVCANIGIACQPKTIRCVGADPAGK